MLPLQNIGGTLQWLMVSQHAHFQFTSMIDNLLVDGNPIDYTTTDGRGSWVEPKTSPQDTHTRKVCYLLASRKSRRLKGGTDYSNADLRICSPGYFSRLTSIPSIPSLSWLTFVDCVLAMVLRLVGGRNTPKGRFAGGCTPSACREVHIADV
jgi:hypothetical protein